MLACANVVGAMGDEKRREIRMWRAGKGGRGNSRREEGLLSPSVGAPEWCIWWGGWCSRAGVVSRSRGGVGEGCYRDGDEVGVVSGSVLSKKTPRCTLRGKAKKQPDSFLWKNGFIIGLRVEATNVV